jgi:nucleoside-diphosphate-sugar epimerase
VARALLVGCGCRGRELGGGLRDAGWRVRGTTRDAARRGEIERAGIEAVVADPDRVGTVLDHVADVTVVAWLLGSASGDPEAVAALHGPRLERLLEELVDTPVRGFVYEGTGSVGAALLREGSRIAIRAAERWRIPVGIVDHDPADVDGWVGAARTEIHALLGA